MCTIRDGKEPEPSNNEPNQNLGFAKNRNKPELDSKNVQEPELNRTHTVNNRTELEPKYRGSYSALSLNVHSHISQSTRRFTLLRLTKFKYQPNDKINTFYDLCFQIN